MEKAMTQQLENMCGMLTKTREEVKILMNLVSTLNMVLTGEYPSPGESKSNPTNLDAEELLRTKNIEVGSRDVRDILQISDSTLKRWRQKGKLEFNYLCINHVTYKLSKLYEAVNTGRVNCRGLGKIKALDRILTYSKDASQLRESCN